MRDALPFLQRATRVTIVEACGGGEDKAALVKESLEGVVVAVGVLLGTGAATSELVGLGVAAGLLVGCGLGPGKPGP